MRNLKKVTKQAILIQKVVVRKPSAVQPIRGTFLLNYLHKTFAIGEEQNIMKTLIFGYQTSFNNSLQKCSSGSCSKGACYSKKHFISLQI